MLFAGTLPANKNEFAGTVPANKNEFAGTISENYIKFYIIRQQLQGSDLYRRSFMFQTI